MYGVLCFTACKLFPIIKIIIVDCNRIKTIEIMEAKIIFKGLEFKVLISKSRFKDGEIEFNSIECNGLDYMSFIEDELSDNQLELFKAAVQLAIIKKYYER